MQENTGPEVQICIPFPIVCLHITDVWAMIAKRQRICGSALLAQYFPAFPASTGENQVISTITEIMAVTHTGLLRITSFSAVFGIWLVKREMVMDKPQMIENPSES